jgi:hypothetical protein
VAVTEAHADIVVTTYSDPSTYPATFGNMADGLLVKGSGTGASFKYAAVPSAHYFTSGADIPGSTGFPTGNYLPGGFYIYGAADISFANYNAGGGPTFDSVAKFDFSGGYGNGILLATAVNPGVSLSISAGKAAIDAAAVPEPSAALLGLLALGATACARRRRHAVPR